MNFVRKNKKIIENNERIIKENEKQIIEQNENNKIRDIEIRISNTRPLINEILNIISIDEFTYLDDVLEEHLDFKEKNLLVEAIKDFHNIEVI
jgi:hypothetical protein